MNIDYYFGKRRSGRTTRMLEAVVVALRQGQRVEIVLHNDRFGPTVEAALRCMWKDETETRMRGVAAPPYPEDLVYWHSADAWSADRPNSLKGIFSPGRVFVYHYLVEERVRAFMQKHEPFLRRWDE